MMRWQLAAGLWLLGFAGAQELPPVSGLPQPVVLRRIAADQQWNLVAALSSSRPCEPAPRPCWWTTKDRLGILLEDRADPRKLLALAIEPGPNDDCSTRIERFTAEELVLSCTGEKWATYDNQKFVYDLRARKLASHFSYAPFAAERASAGSQFVVRAGETRLAVAIDAASGDPRVTNAEAPPARAPSEGTFGRFRLSKETTEEPAIVGDGKVYPAEMNEQIGPHQVEGGLFWFGKTFYNGEGETGIGGFGYFDPGTASFHLFAPAELAAWSVSAILVAPDCIWLGLEHRGEYGDYPGGLLRWDRNLQTVRKWDMTSIATSIVRADGGIYLGLTDGIAVLRGDRVVSFFVDRSAAGQYRMAARN